MFDFSFDPTDQYTFWSGTIAALFLFLSYFGTDQSQVQRYLTAKSRWTRRASSLLMSAYWKIPLQALVLLIGVLHVRVLPVHAAADAVQPRARRSRSARARGGGVRGARSSSSTRRSTTRRKAAEQLAAATPKSGDAVARALPAPRSSRWTSEVKAVRGEAVALVKRRLGRQHLQRRQLRLPDVRDDAPAGRTGGAADRGDLRRGDVHHLGGAGVALDGDGDRLLSALDPARRPSDSHLLNVSRLATGSGAVFASVVAIWAAELGSLIEVVNRFGSFFYGSILGVFMLAIGWPRANGTGAFVGLIAGMGIVGYVATLDDDRLPLAQPDRRRRGVRRRHRRVG